MNKVTDYFSWLNVLTYVCIFYISSCSTFESVEQKKLCSNSIFGLVADYFSICFWVNIYTLTPTRTDMINSNCLAIPNVTEKLRSIRNIRFYTIQWGINRNQLKNWVSKSFNELQQIAAISVRTIHSKVLLTTPMT